MYLTLNSISKSYENTDKETINDVSLEIEKGEFICIVGPSGCGKSTILNMIAGLLTPTSGEIILDGQAVTAPGADRVVMFQEAALYPWLTVYENVMFGLDLTDLPKQEKLERAEKYLNMVKLWKYRDYRVHEVSGGMKQRAALARALALDGKVLLMDEPFSALDKQTINVLRWELEQIWEKTGKTIVYITHSVEEAVYFADRVVVMSENPGRIKDIIPIDIARPRHVEDEKFVALRKQILDQVGQGVKKSMMKEYDLEENNEN